MKNIDYAFWKKNQSVLNFEHNQRILKNYFKVPEYWPYQRTLISFSKYINFVPNLTQFNFYFKLRDFFQVRLNNATFTYV